MHTIYHIMKWKNELSRIQVNRTERR